MITPSNEKITLLPNSETSEFNRQSYTYDIHSIEMNDPRWDDVASIAQYLQGQEYIRAGYIEPSKLTDGRLIDPDDKRRNITYFAACPKGEGLNSIDATVKLVQVPQDGQLESLAAYDYCKDTLSNDAHERINAAFKKNPDRGIIELAGLCRAENPVSPFASYELMRELTQRAIRSKSEELWLITFTNKAHKAINMSYGPKVVEVAGGEVRIEKPDEHVTLIPCLINPTNLLDNMVDTIESEKNDKRKRRLSDIHRGTLCFMADGLMQEELSDKVRDFIILGQNNRGNVA